MDLRLALSGDVPAATIWGQMRRTKPQKSQCGLGSGGTVKQRPGWQQPSRGHFFNVSTVTPKRTKILSLFLGTVCLNWSIFLHKVQECRQHPDSQALRAAGLAPWPPECMAFPPLFSTFQACCLFFLLRTSRALVQPLHADWEAFLSSSSVPLLLLPLTSWTPTHPQDSGTVHLTSWTRSKWSWSVPVCSQGNMTRCLLELLI